MDLEKKTCCVMENDLVVKITAMLHQSVCHFSDPAFANLSAASLPAIPLCPGTWVYRKGEDCFQLRAKKNMNNTSSLPTYSSCAPSPSKLACM